MHLSPETPDRFVKTKSPAFLLKSAASVDGFVHTLKSTLPPPMAVPSKLLVEVLSAFGEGPWEGVSEETLLDRLLALIKEKLIKLYGEDVKDIDLYQTQIREEPEEPPRFKRMTVDLLKQILFEDSLPFNTVEGRKEIVNNLIANADIEVGFFQRKESELKFNETILSGVETEKRSIGIQFFLATIALYCRAHGLSNKNFGEVIDSNREKLSQSIKEAIEQKKPVDQVLFNFIETHLEALGLESLTVEQQTTIKAQFFNQWETIKDSPHFDEFLVFFPEIQGDVFNHRGRLSVSALDVVLRSDDVNSIISTYGLDGQSEALKAAAERKLPRSNQALSKRSFDTLLGEHAVTYPMLRHLKGDWWVNPASINKLLSLGLPPEKYTSNRMDWLNTLSPEAFDEKLGELMRRETFDGSLLSLDILKSIIALLNKPGLSPQATSGLDKLLAKRGRSYDRLNTLDKDELKAVLEAFPPEGQHLIHLILPTPKDLAYFINGCESMEKLSVFQQTFFESLGPKELIDLIKHLEPTQCGKAVELMRWMRPEASLSILFENNFLEKIEANRGQAFFDAAGNLTKDYLLSLTPEARIGICSDAVSFGYVYLMEQCFNQGVSPNALYKGRRLTSIAVEKNQGKCLQRLLNEGALWVKESPSLL